MCNDERLLAQLEKTPSFYLYDGPAVLAAAKRLRADYPGVEFLYSVKANPAGRVLDAVFSQGFGADAASLNEVLRARERGLSPERIFFSAPGRTAADLAAALTCCTVAADSFHELELLNQAAAALGGPVGVGLRLNPDFTFAGAGGVPSKFGVDEDTFFENAQKLCQLKNLRITGIHVHAKSQELNPAALEGYYRRMFDLAERAEAALGGPLDFVNFGSGLGIPWGAGDTPLDTAALGGVFTRLLADFRAAHPKTRVLIETGRFVTGPYGVYVTQVADKKTSRGTTFVLLHNTLNGFARPAVGRMVAAANPGAAPCEPLYAGADTYALRVLRPGAETETVTLAGNLCTAADILAKDAALPRLEIGDGVVFTNAGCYSAVMTPMQFASLTPPAELFLTEDGEIVPA